MSLEQIVKILQIGFSGFAFLMAGLSFRLLSAEANRIGTPRKALLDAIQRYTRYTLLLALLVVASRFGEDAYRAHVEQVQSDSIRDAADAAVCRDGLSRLVSADSQIAANYDSLLRAVQTDTSGCKTVLKLLERGK